MNAAYWWTTFKQGVSWATAEKQLGREPTRAERSRMLLVLTQRLGDSVAAKDSARQGSSIASGARMLTRYGQDAILPFPISGPMTPLPR